jgi:dCMP deaminase
MTRASWDQYFIDLGETVATRATCDRGKSGCVITRENRILSTGYVGSPPGMPHCDEVGHLLKKVIDDDGKITMHCFRTIHAEQNAITQAARFGISLEGATLYSKMEPCSTCAKLIAAVGIKRVVCAKKYHAAQESRDILKQTGVVLDVLSNEVEEYEKQ